METSSQSTSPDQQEQPPVFKRWSGWYALLLIVLAVLVALFYWFSIAFV